MRKENKWLLINAGIVVIISALFILLYAFVLPVSDYDSVFGKKVTLSVEEVVEAIPSTDSYSVINKKVTATKKDKVVGDIYSLIIKNGYGRIELLVGIDSEDKVSVVPVLIDQSHIDIENMNGLIVKQIKKDYNKIAALDLLDFSGELNVGTIETKASESTGSILSLLQRTVKVHLDLVETDIIEELFGEYDEVEDIGIDSNLITSKYNVTFKESGEKGFIYTLTKNGDYHGYQGEELNGDITLKVLVIEDVIKHIEIVEKEYGHTPGFKTQVETFLEGWIDTKLNDYPNIDDVDLETGSTGSTTLVDSMLRELRDEHISGPFGKVFGINHEIVADDSFTATSHVIAKADVLVEGTVVGYVFTLRNSGVYHREEGAIEMEVAVKDGKISAYRFTVYEHTPGFRVNVTGFIKGWLGTDLSDYPNLDSSELKTGSTNTTTMVDEMFRELRDKYNTMKGGE